MVASGKKSIMNTRWGCEELTESDSDKIKPTALIYRRGLRASRFSSLRASAVIPPVLGKRRHNEGTLFPC